MLYIHFLGHLRLFEDDRPLCFSALPKTLPLWACLLLNRTTPLPRSTLAYTLWPDISESSARSKLRRHLYDLKQALPRPAPGRPWLLLQAGTVQWNPSADFWLDIAEFERLSMLPHHLARAVTLYGGDLLPEVYDDCIRIERERLRSLYLEDLNRLVAQCREGGDLAQAIAYTEVLLRQDPLREDAVRELMRLRCQAGDRPGALQVYQDFRGLLQEELGLSSMPETRALYEAVLHNTPLAEVAAPVVAPSCPHNLPAQVTRFIGREVELAALVDLLLPDRSPVRLLTLVGSPGVGKTRLALEAAARLLPQQARTFPDGIFFIDLAPLATPDLVLPAIAQALKIREKGHRPLETTLKEFLRHRHILLLLDNWEHVVRAAPQVGELLAAAPNLRVLATSRIPLRLYGEQEYSVEPLPVPAARTACGDEPESVAADLFVDRARARRPDFCLSASDRAAVAEICVHLGGLPLAIELAASQIKTRPPAEILEALKRHPAALSGGPVDWPARHRTLRRALDWSCDLLAPGERSLLALLSLFVGGCTLPAAEAVCAPFYTGDVAAGLVVLVEHSLMRRGREEGEPRFTMLVPIREYARGRLERLGWREEAGRRYADYYAELAETARREWKGPRQAFWLKQLSAEVDNLRAALEWTLQESADAARVQSGAKLAYALGAAFWEVHGRIGEGRSWLERALLYRERLPAAMQVRLLNLGGWFAQQQGEYEAAGARYQEGIALARQEEDAMLIGMSLHSLGTMAGRRGDYEQARPLLEEAIAVEREASGGETTAHLSTILNNLAIVLKHLGEYERAAALLEESLAFKRAQGDHLGVASSLVNLGNLALARDDCAGAEESFRESLRLRLALGDRKGMLTLLPGLAEVALRQGQAVRSARLYAADQALRRDMGYPLTAAEQEAVERHIATLRGQLGAAHFAAAWAAGEAMTLEQAAAYAVGPSPA